MTPHWSIDPWFLGQDGPGLPLTAAAELFGPRVHILRGPGDPPLDLQEGAELRGVLTRIGVGIAGEMMFDPRPRKTRGSYSVWLGTQGVGITWPISGADPREEQAYPYALRVLDGYRLLSPEESQCLVLTLRGTPRRQEAAS